MHEYHLKAIPTSVGSPSASLTAVMSGQIDVGWAAPPFGLDQLDAKQIRIIVTGNDAAAFKGQTVRLNIANVQSLATKKDAIVRYMKAYRETVDYLYGDPNALKVYADWLKISEEKAKRPGMRLLIGSGQARPQPILWRSRSWRAITTFWISLVPSPMSRNGASRYRRSIVYSCEYP